MSPRSRRLRLALVGLLALGGLLPILVYWMLVGRAPTLDPREARIRLTDPSRNASLVDVRTPEEFATSHLEGAVNWPLASIESTAATQPLPPGLENRQLLVICASGIRSARAARLLQPRLGERVLSVRGGLQEWTALPGPACPIGMALASAQRPAASPLPSRAAPPYEQWAAVLTGFGVKPAYMLLTLGLILWLRRSRAADLVALRWALVAFLAGESFCALNYLLCHEESYLLDYLHSFGMVVAFGFTTWALMEGLDAHVVRFSHPSAPCAWAPLCHRCIKRNSVPCGLRRIFLWVLIPAVLVLALLPLTMGFRYQAYTTTILGTPYGYLHPVAQQYFEFRYLPLVAALCAFASLAVMLLRERHPLPVAKALFAAALGALGFAYFRLLLLAPFADNQVWFTFWEEITELLYVLAVAAVLVVFRAGLLAAETSLRPVEEARA